jgi:2-polyprenyl-6-methoxyphenol hydroxylase-like FAD-dependent oxidoreductase
MKKGSHAVVIGGSMAGLLTARILADHFDRVSVVERDGLVDTLEPPAVRKGVPQGRHVHGFWARGLDYLERILPGLRNDLVDGGAISGDVARDFVWHHFGETKLRESVGVPATVMTRPFLERAVRHRVMALPEVTFIAGQSVTGFISDPDNTRVTGVRVKPPDGPKWDLLADLVVDASGRSGVVSRWLAGVGYESPPETKVRIDVTHATRFFRRSQPTDAFGYLIAATPPFGRRAGICFAVEGGRWQMTLIGRMGEEPPTDSAGFREFAGSLPLSALHEIASCEEPLGEVATYRFPFNRRRHYEQLKLFPEGLIAIGDALASFNPAYGQGMTVVALEVEALERILTSSADLRGIARRFFAEAAKIIDIPWSIALAEDLRYPEAQGKRAFSFGPINAYLTRVHHAAAIDPVVCRTFFEVAGLQKRPSALFAPELVWRSLFPGRPELRHGRQVASDNSLEGVPDGRMKAVG